MSKNRVISVVVILQLVQELFFYFNDKVVDSGKWTEKKIADEYLARLVFRNLQTSKAVKMGSQQSHT